MATTYIDTSQSSTACFNNIYLSDYGQYLWHDGKTMISGGYVTTTRPSIGDSRIYATGNVQIHQYGGNSYNMWVQLSLGGTALWEGWIDVYRGAENTLSFNNVEVTWASSENITLNITAHCQGEEYDDCVWGDDYYHTNSQSISVPGYNPYTAPTFSITDWTKKARASAASRTISYTISGGTGNIDWVAPEVYTTNKTWSDGKWNDRKGTIQSTRVYPPSGVEVGNGQEPGSSYKLFNGGTSTSVTQTNQPFGNYSGSRQDVKKLSDCLASGSKYRLAIHFSDNSYEWVSKNYDYLYTYTEPTLTRSKSI